MRRALPGPETSDYATLIRPTDYYKAIGEWVDALGHKALERFRVRLRNGVRKPPCQSTIRTLLIRVDPEQLDRALQRWHQQHGGQDEALAIDGKTLRNACDPAAAWRHSPVSVICCPATKLSWSTAPRRSAPGHACLSQSTKRLQKYSAAHVVADPYLGAYRARLSPTRRLRGRDASSVDRAFRPAAGSARAQPVTCNELPGENVDLRAATSAGGWLAIRFIRRTGTHARYSIRRRFRSREQFGKHGGNHRHHKQDRHGDVERASMAGVAQRSTNERTVCRGPPLPRWRRATARCRRWS